MSEKYNKAVDALRDEMAKAADRGELAVIGEYLTDRLQRDPALADKLAEKGKSLAGAFDVVKAWARKNAKSGFCYVTPGKVFELVCEYYGIPAAAMPGRQPEAPKQETDPSLDALDLDALMG